MKNMKFALILITCCTLFFACKKDGVQNVPAPVSTEKVSGSMVVKESASAQVSGVPQKAYTVADYVAKNGKAPNGYVGGTVFQNREGLLPQGVSYKEYDVNPKVSGQNRGPERIVLGSNGSRYYTGDHYKTFIKF